ncbi:MULTISPECIES: hypothetical protein [unclassified Polaromonas]|uniref:hypothetical protein n=1 Tax=unclassified Polaromonas TaxID=2638319 RepID=UPI0018C91753|nr:MULTISPECIES: hypothetical protein [unclassified Polaromonas]MBG6070423.1 hypothetical protein [Polaromonas sp. CG_9.7]MBG6112421.1 hypothetical protein [Polaromonas sp. CG_9.2]MDH6184068.1 hypothetical protein [Polaromonas sp. CG_23.6]
MRGKMQQAGGDAVKGTHWSGKPWKSECQAVWRTKLHPFFCPRNQTMQAYAADAKMIFKIGGWPSNACTGPWRALV